MFIAFVLILLFILLWVLASTYSVFAPFSQNIWDVVDFNSAYYGAIAGVERANLILKYKQPGFEWSGWYFWTTKFGPPSDYITGAFGSVSTGSNGISWQITSRTNTIPSSGDGNVDALLASSDSRNYNQLPYFTTERIALDYDNSASNQDAYTWTTSISYFRWGSFSGYFRLPPKVKTAFSDAWLCWTDTAGCDLDGDETYDDVAINRKLKWSYNWTLFSILPNSDINVTSGYNQVIANKDTMLRESIVDTNSWAVYFGKNNVNYYFNPILKYTLNTLTKHNVISSDPSVMESIAYDSATTSILNNNLTKDLEFSFGVVNLLYSTNNNIYPFLEYQISFGAPIPNRFYTIEWKSLVGNYNVRIIMKKSTTSDSQIGDFTVVF